MRHLTSLLELTAEEIDEILGLASSLKASAVEGVRPSRLAGRVLTQIFEKPSLRTRASFDAAMAHLGGSSQFFSAKDAGLGGRESVEDVARVISGYSDVLVLRTFSQRMIERFAEMASCPVINALSDDRHPCQALTDLLTIRETCGTLAGRRLVFVGDGNNVARSLAIACGRMGVSMTLAAPDGYEFDEEFLGLFDPLVSLDSSAEELDCYIHLVFYFRSHFCDLPEGENTQCIQFLFNEWPNSLGSLQVILFRCSSSSKSGEIDEFRLGCDTC